MKKGTDVKGKRRTKLSRGSENKRRQLGDPAADSHWACSFEAFEFDMVTVKATTAHWPFTGGGSSLSHSQSSTIFPVEILAGSSGFLCEASSGGLHTGVVSSVVSQGAIEGGFGPRLVESGSESPVTRRSSWWLSWWLAAENLLKGAPFTGTPPEQNLFSGASRHGWGAHLELLWWKECGPCRNKGYTLTNWNSWQISRPIDVSAGSVGLCSFSNIRQLHCVSSSRECRGYLFRVPFSSCKGGSSVA